MIKTIQGLPVYRAILGDNTDGMERISLVDLPAVESDFLAFDKEKRPMMFAVENEEKRIIRGVVMRADYPIYRIGTGGYEYYILFEKETIRQMAQKYLRESRQNEINLMHEDGTEVQGVEMVQWFIKDTENGISPKGFEEISDGSLFAEFKVENNDVWESVKKGEFKGFSLEGLFSHELMQMSSAKAEIINNINEIEDMTKLDKIKDALSKVLVQEEVKCGNIGTDKGVLHWEGEETIAVDMEVWQEDEAGERIAVENGDYTLEDGTIIRVAEGKVTEIVEKEAEEEEKTTEEETTEEEVKLSQYKERVEKYSLSYSEKMKKIYNAFATAKSSEYFYVYDAGDDFAIVNVYSEGVDKYYRYTIAWEGEDVVIGDEGVEVRQAFIPIDYEVQFAKIEKRVEELTDIVELITNKMSKMSMALPAKKEVKKEETTDIKGLDRAKAMMAGLRRY